jgi:ribonuclease HI
METATRRRCKINFYAALNANDETVGLGIIARNADGRFIGVWGERMKTSVTPMTAEALAALHAVIFARDKGYEDVIFEGDALQVVSAVNSNNPCETNFGTLWRIRKQRWFC